MHDFFGMLCSMFDRKVKDVNSEAGTPRAKRSANHRTGSYQ